MVKRNSLHRLDCNFGSLWHFWHCWQLFLVIVPVLPLNHEGIPQTAGAHSLLRRLQIAGPLPGLLVLEVAGRADTISAPAQAAYRPRICAALRPAHTG